MVTENEAGKAWARVRTQLSLARFSAPIGLRELRIDAETFQILEEWERQDCLALRQEYQGIVYKGVKILPPYGYKPPEELGR